MVYIEGIPVQETYEKDGQTQRSFKIKLAGPQALFKLVGKKSDDSTAGTPTPVKDSKIDDDIPF